MVLCEEDAPQYGRLPDLGRHISAVLQKHHVAHMAPSTSCLRGVNKTAEKVSTVVRYKLLNPNPRP
jgi:hypothetical protein